MILEFCKKYAEAKKEKNIIDFNDIEHFALKILINEDESKTEVAKKYTEKFEEILIDELSEQADVFNYEFVCDLGKRIPRVYIKNGEIVGTKDYYNDDYEINI